MVRHLTSVLVLWVALVMSAQAALPDYGKASLEALVDDLTTIDREAPGLSSMANYGGFFVDDRSPGFRSGVLGAPSVTVPPPMREVVRRGAAAVPILVEHLDDRRPTRLVVGGMIDQGGWGISAKSTTAGAGRIGFLTPSRMTPGCAKRLFGTAKS